MRVSGDRSPASTAASGRVAGIFSNTILITAVSGVATFSYRIRPTTHHVLALISIAVNLGCAMVEYRAIARNGRIIDRILAAIASGG